MNFDKRKCIWTRWILKVCFVKSNRSALDAQNNSQNRKTCVCDYFDNSSIYFDDFLKLNYYGSRHRLLKYAKIEQMGTEYISLYKKFEKNGCTPAEEM